MFDWDQDMDDLTNGHCPPKSQMSSTASPNRGRIRRALMTLGVPMMVVVALFAAPSFAPASSGTARGTFGLSRLAMDAEMPAGLLSYDRAQFDNFRRGIARFSDSELLAYAAATRRDQSNPRLSLADWDRDALRLTDLEITLRGLRPPVVVNAHVPIAIPASAI